MPHRQTQTQKRQKLLKCVLTGNSKLYLGNAYTEERIKELSDEEVDKLFSNYEAKLSGQIHSFIIYFTYYLFIQMQ